MRIKPTAKLCALALTAFVYTLPASAADPVPMPPPAPPAPVMVPPAPMPPAPPAAPAFAFGPAPAEVALEPIADKKLRKKRDETNRVWYSQCMTRNVANASLRALGLTGCDKALAVGPDENASWDRRAQLLQSRAVYLVTLGQQELALDALAESDAIGKKRNDPLFEGSVAIGNGMLRAVALGRLKRLDEANAELARLRTIRPYATVITRQIDKIEGSFDPDINRLTANLTEKIKWQPDILRALMPLYLLRGDLEAAGAIADQVSLIDPKMAGGWTVADGNSDVQKFLDAMKLEGQRAYIWAGLGIDDRANAVVAGAYNDITGYIGNPPPIKKETGKPSKKDQEKYDARVATGEAAKAMIGGWEKAIELRRAAPASSISPEEMLDQVETLKGGAGIILIDILRQMRSDDRRTQDQLDKLIELMDMQMAKSVFDMTFTELSQGLPPAEHLEALPKYKWGEKGGLFSGPNHSQSKEKDSEARTIRYASYSDSPAIAEELALMAVAEYAEREGKDSFILLARRIMPRRIHHSSCFYYSCSATSTEDAGYESQVRVALLDSNAIPAEYANYGSRIISVAQIKADLKPRFDEYEARKQAVKEAEKAAKNRR